MKNLHILILNKRKTSQEGTTMCELEAYCWQLIM